MPTVVAPGRSAEVAVRHAWIAIALALFAFRQAPAQSRGDSASASAQPSHCTDAPDGRCRSLYAAVSLGTTRFDSPGLYFAAPEASVGSVTLGRAVGRKVFVEGRISRLGYAETRYDPPVEFNDAPLVVGVRATVHEAIVGLRPTVLRAGVLQPVIRAGVVRARVVDRHESDTPATERSAWENGLILGGAIEASLGRGLALVAGGTHRSMRRERSRAGYAIDIGGTSWELGAVWRP